MPDNTRKLIATEWMSLDGVFDANSMDKWWLPYHSEERGESIRDTILESDAMLMGRTTYEMLAPHWSALKNDEMGVADRLNSAPKYVVSTTLKDATWNNSTIISKNVSGAVADLKKQQGKNILIMGSATLVDSLMKAELVDEFRLLVQPIVMGVGKRFFKDGMGGTKLALIRTETLPLGVVQHTYRPPKE